jgi:hypothetical protein
LLALQERWLRRSNIVFITGAEFAMVWCIDNAQGRRSQMSRSPAPLSLATFLYPGVCAAETLSVEETLWENTQTASGGTRSSILRQET